MTCQGCNREKKDFLGQSPVEHGGSWQCTWTPGKVTYSSKSEMKRIEALKKCKADHPDYTSNEKIVFLPKVIRDESAYDWIKYSLAWLNISVEVDETITNRPIAAAMTKIERYFVDNADNRESKNSNTEGPSG